MMIRDFRDLTVWRRAVALAVSVYRVTRSFPRSERYGLCSQMQHASVSVAANIAEGNARSRREYLHFLSISRGSLSELETLLEIVHQIGFLSASHHQSLSAEATQIGRMLWSMRNAVAMKKGKREEGRGKRGNDDT